MHRFLALAQYSITSNGHSGRAVLCYRSLLTLESLTAKHVFEIHLERGSHNAPASYLHLGWRRDGLGRRKSLRVPAPGDQASPGWLFLLLRRDRDGLGLLGRRSGGRGLLRLGTKLMEVSSIGQRHYSQVDRGPT